MFRWATMAPAAIAITTTIKPFTRLASEFHDAPPLKPVLAPAQSAACRPARPLPTDPSTSCGTGEIAAVRVVGIERGGNRGTPRLERRENRGQDDERGAGRADEATDDRPAKRRALPAAFAIGTTQHCKTGHQDRTQTAPCAFYCRLPWLAARDPASVVPVSQSMSTTPAMTAGMVNPTANESRKDWKFAASSRRITPTAIRSPRRRPANISALGWTCPRNVTLTRSPAENAARASDLQPRP